MGAIPVEYRVSEASLYRAAHGHVNMRTSGCGNTGWNDYGTP